MRIFWRDLVWGVIAWLAAGRAAAGFPQFTLLDSAYVAKTLAFILFEPTQFVTSLLFLTLSYWFLFRPLLANMRRLLTGGTHSVLERIVSGVLTGYFFLLYLLQLIKFPFCTCLVTLVVLLYCLYRFWISHKARLRGL
ncbi:hypothetical protein [Brevibacillus fulvus]|uniref:Uncharacterized protein n=1 Tax=Brevibacillus fulvus TaxID=1125967 RepID=A0A939BTP8_9BACL|nr:hypothetical protein [Brevibacillus fulvus]MBM7588676.1 hypothetical protein [Brevibacillus fulvus]